MALRDVVSYLITANDQTRGAVQSARGNMESLRGSFESVQRVARSMGSLTAGFVSIAGLKAGTSALIDTRVEMERVRNTLAQGVGAANVASEFQFIRKAADDFGQSFGDVASSYARFTAASRGTALEGQQTRDIFLGLSTASTVLGLSADQMNGALTAVQQMMSKGKVSAEELRGQLGERLPGAFQIAARAMGVTTGELDRMMAAGELMAEDFLPRFSRALQTEFAGGLETAGKSAAATVNRLSTAWEELKQKFAESPVGDATFAGIRLLTKDLEHLANVMNAQKLGVGSSSVFGFTEDDIAFMRGLRTNPAELGEARLNRKGGPPARISTAEESLRDIRAQDRALDNTQTRAASAEWTKLAEKFRTAAERQADVAREIRATGVQAGKSEAEINKLIAAQGEGAGKKAQAEAGRRAREEYALARERLQAEREDINQTEQTEQASVQRREGMLRARYAAGLETESAYYDQRRHLIAEAAVVAKEALEDDNKALAGFAANTKDRIDLDRQMAANVAKNTRIHLQAEADITEVTLEQTAAIRRRTAAYDEARAAQQRFLDEQGTAQLAEVEGMGLGQQERDRRAARNQIVDRYSSMRQQLNSQRAEGAFAANPEQYDKELEIINEFQQKALGQWDSYYAAVRQKHGDGLAGAREAMADFVTASQDHYSQVYGLMNTTFSSMGGVIADFAKTGEFSMRRFREAVLAELSQIATNRLLGMLLQAMGGMTRLGGSTTVGGAGWGSQNDFAMATGTNYVPHDGFRAMLHEGEAVVPKKYNPAAGGQARGNATTIVQHINFNGSNPGGGDPQRIARMVGDVAVARLREAQSRNGR